VPMATGARHVLAGDGGRQAAQIYVTVDDLELPRPHRWRLPTRAESC
jgi:hypothetical protein